MNDCTFLGPLDRSRFAECALPAALGLAQTLDGRIELVSVFEQDRVLDLHERFTTAAAFSALGSSPGQLKPESGAGHRLDETVVPCLAKLPT